MKLKLASALRSFRDQKGYSQNYMAICLDVSTKTYSRMEKGESVPRITIIPWLVNLFGLSLYELIKRIIDEEDAHSTPPPLHPITSSADRRLPG